MLTFVLVLTEGDDVLRMCGLEFDITIGDDVYKGAGQIASVEEFDVKEGVPDRRTQASINLLEQEDFARFAVDPGPIPIEVGWAKSLDDGQTWTRVSTKIEGQLSGGSIVGGQFSFEVETLKGDVDRGGLLVNSHEAQEAEFPGDLGFEYARQIEAGGLEVAAPR